MATAKTSVSSGLMPAAWLPPSATAARTCLHRPDGIAAGPSGEVYVADTYHGRIRRIAMAASSP